jgi:hypothetical protein
MKSYRVFTLASLLLGAALLAPRGSAHAQSDEDLCREVGCSGGEKRCASIYGSIRDERCEEGVMCCPFPEELFFIPCYEGAI